MTIATPIPAHPGALTKREEFRRGWRIILASTLGAGTGAVPLAFYSFGAFVKPLMDGFGWTRAQITAAPLFLTVGGLAAGLIAGAAADRFGARRIVLMSQLALALGFVLLALTPPSLPYFYAGYAALAVLGAGTMTMTWARAVTGWFFAARGLALGLSLIGTGLIGALMPSYVNMLAAAHGWRAAYLGLAVLPLLGFPLAFVFFRDAPGDRFSHSGRRDPIAASPEDRDSHDFGQAIRSWCFWQMTLSFSVVAVAIASVIVHCVPMLIDRGISPTTAAWLAGLIGIAVTIGRLASGFSLDVMRGPTVAFIVFILPALSCAILLFSGSSLWLSGIAIFIVGLAGGAEHDIAAYFCARYFGRRHYGKIYGLLYTLYGVGTGIGPWLVGRIVDRTGSYDSALITGGILFASAAFLIVALKAPGSPAAQHP